MKPGVNQDQGGEEGHSATGSVMTPPTRDGESTIIDAQWDGLPYAVPWPGSTFIIVEKATGRAITVRDGKVGMEEHAVGASAGASSHRGKQWFCVEKNGHFGFQNQASGKYIGHDGNFGIRASVSHLLAHEFIVVRKHPQGGYQLLALHDKGLALRVISVNEDGDGLVTREHGPTLWEFYKV